MIGIVCEKRTFVKKYKAMSALQIRKELREIIEVVDDKLVAAVYVMLQSLIQDDDSVVAHTTSGHPLTKEAFFNQVRESYAAGKQGKVKTTAELLAEIQTW